MSYDDSYLMHHGVKGMHWGVRRYRNYDGTLTSAGKAQRRAQNSGSSGGGGGGHRGMSAKTKKRLATAAKVAGAAAAVGGAAYLANRASGGKAGMTAAGTLRSVRNVAGKQIGDATKNARSRVGKAARRVGDTVSDVTAPARNRFANTRAGKALDDYRAQGGLKSTASKAREEISGRIAANKAVGKAAVDRARDVAGAARQVAGVGKRAVRRGAMGVADTVSTGVSNAAGRAKSSASYLRSRASGGVVNTKTTKPRKQQSLGAQIGKAMLTGTAAGAGTVLAGYGAYKAATNRSKKNRKRSSRKRR
jgi:hypothetical protein